MLTKEEPIKTYNLGIIAPRSFDDEQFLHELVGQNILKVAKIVTNNVISGGETVQRFSKNICIPLIVFPICAGKGGVFVSNQQVIDNSEFVYLINDGQSHNLKIAESQCIKSNRKYKIIEFKPLPSKQASLDRIGELISDRLKKLLENPETKLDATFLEKLLTHTK